VDARLVRGLKGEVHNEGLGFISCDSARKLVFELAGPGKDFVVYSEAHLRRTAGR
jgi:hypothetical protein